jgi:hypothetical protein
MAQKGRSNGGKRVDATTVQEFDKLHGQLQAFYEEVSILSKKNPDGKLNKFKLDLINGILKKATVFLGDSYRPFPDFETFPDEDLPSTSDVGMMLSQYLGSMNRFRREHSHEEWLGEDRVRRWDGEDGPVFVAQ